MQSPLPRVLSLRDDGAQMKWLIEGEKYLQMGIMFLCRAVAKPDGF